MEYLMSIYLTDLVNAKPINFPYYTGSSAFSLLCEYQNPSNFFNGKDLFVAPFKTYGVRNAGNFCL